MDKKELINKFQKLKEYYGNNLPLGELQHKIEIQFTASERNALFQKTLSQYINQLHKLKSWTQLSQKKQQL